VDRKQLCRRDLEILADYKLNMSQQWAISDEGQRYRRQLLQLSSQDFRRSD